MKKFIIMALAAIASLTVSAQSNSCQEVGSFSIEPMVGVSISSLSEGNNTDPRVGFMAGVEGQYMVNKWFSVGAEVDYKQMGVKDKDSDVTLKNDYISVPVLAGFYIFKGFAIKTGIELDFNVSKKVSNGNVSAKLSSNEVKGSCVSLPVNISYEFSHVVIGAHLNWGLSDAVSGGSKNGFVAVTAGYRF